MRRVEYSASFDAFGKWGDVADGNEPFALTDIPEDVYSETVEKLENIRKAGERVLDLSVSIMRGDDDGKIRVTARGVTD